MCVSACYMHVGINKIYYCINVERAPVAELTHTLALCKCKHIWSTPVEFSWEWGVHLIGYRVANEGS